MPVFEKDGHHYLFIHIPKTGGTTIEDVLVNNGFSMTFRRGGRYGPLTAKDKALGCSPQHMHGSLLENFFGDTEFDQVFTVVRHPTVRLVSEYKFRRFISEDRKFPDISSWIGQIEEAYSRTPFLFDNHIRPQTEFIWPGSCKVYMMEKGHHRIFADIDSDLGAITYRGEHLTALPDPDQSSLLEIADPFARNFYSVDFDRFGYRQIKNG